MQRPVTGVQRFRVTVRSQTVGTGPPPPAAGRRTADAAAPADGSASPDVDPGDDGTGDDGDDDGPPADDPADATKTTSSSEATDDAKPSSDDAAATTDDAAPSGTDAADADATDEPTPDAASIEPDVPRLQTTIWIIRPLGVEAEGDAEATDPHVGHRRSSTEQGGVADDHGQGDGADVEPMDVRELRMLPAQGTLAFRYRQNDADQTIELTVTQARFDVQEMIATVVSRGWSRSCSARIGRPRTAAGIASSRPNGNGSASDCPKGSCLCRCSSTTARFGSNRWRSAKSSRSTLITSTSRGRGRAMSRFI